MCAKSGQDMIARQLGAASYLGSKVTQTITFVNTPGGAINLFTVTGDVIVRLLVTCMTTVTSAAGANGEVGIAGDTDAIIGATVMTLLAAREIWCDNTPDSEIEALSDALKEHYITDGNDIILTTDAQVDTGVLRFDCYWMSVYNGSVAI